MQKVKKNKIKWKYKANFCRKLLICIKHTNIIIIQKQNKKCKKTDTQTLSKDISNGTKQQNKQISQNVCRVNVKRTKTNKQTEIQKKKKANTNTNLNWNFFKTKIYYAYNQSFHWR